MRQHFNTSPQTDNDKKHIVDFKKLPHSVDHTASTSTVVFTFLFGLFWSAISLTIAYAFLNDPKEGLIASIFIALFISIFVLIGLAVLLTAVHLFTSTKLTTFHKNHVQIDSKTLLKGKTSQTIPYHQFQGLLLDIAIVHQNKHSITYQIIDLVHDNSELTQRLYMVRGQTPPREIWKDYISQLRIPGLQKDGKDFIILDHDDFDMTLQQRSYRQYTKTDSTALSTQEPPKGLSIQSNERSQKDLLQIHILSGRVPHTTKAIVFFFPVFFICLPLLDQNVPMIFPIIGCLFLLLVLAMAIHDKKNKRQIKISRSEITIIDNIPYSQHSKNVKTIPLSQIENILIKGDEMTKNITINKHIVIIGKKGEIQIGTGLPATTLKWLQDYLRAAVVSA